MARPRGFDAEQALERAMRLFWRQGYGATSPQQLAEELGVGKGSLYAAFGGKRELFGRALARYGEVQGAAAAAPLSGPEPAEQRLLAALLALLEASAAPAGRPGCLAVNTAAELGRSDPEAAAEIARQAARMRERLEAVLAEGQATGRIRDDLPARDLALQLHALGTGLQLLVRIEEPEGLLPAVRAAIAQLAPVRAKSPQSDGPPGEE